jgi:hypothetical protein
MHTGGEKMALLQVRGFPNDLYDELIRISRSENRSVAQQTIVFLRSALGGQSSKKLQRQKMLCELMDDQTAYPPELTPAEKLIREDRDR